MTERWKSVGQRWCEVCGCWVKDQKAAWANHERGVRHREALEKRIREGQRRGAREERERQEAEAALQVAGEAAEKAFALDSAAAAAVAAPGEASDWALDPASGLYWSHQLGCYFCGRSRQYWGGDPPRWSPVPPAKPGGGGAAAAATGSAAAATGPAAAATGPAAAETGSGAAAAGPKPAAGGAGGGSGGWGTTGPRLAGPGKGEWRPVQKVVEATNTALGGRQMPLTKGSAGAARGVTSGAPGVRAGGVRAKKGTAKKGAAVKVDPEEAHALAVREAARRRVEQRSLKEFGLG